MLMMVVMEDVDDGGDGDVDDGGDGWMLMMVVGDVDVDDGGGGC